MVRSFISRISIHALLAESDFQFLPLRFRFFISIHALLAESDFTTIITICTAWKFLSTLSLRRATYANLRRHRSNDDFYPRSPCGERLVLRRDTGAYHRISIHALLAESD